MQQHCSIWALKPLLFPSLLVAYCSYWGRQKRWTNMLSDLKRHLRCYFPLPWWVPVSLIFQQKDWHDFVLLFPQLLRLFFKGPKAVRTFLVDWIKSCAQSIDVLIVAPGSCLTQVGARYLPAHRRGDSGLEQNSAAQKMLKLNSEGPTEFKLSPDLSNSWARAKCLDLST